MAVVNGSVKVSELDRLARSRFEELEKKREFFAGTLRMLLDPKNKLGRWSPHYMPALRDLLAIEMQIDGFKYALDLETPE